jgi:hypothetical protein
MTAPGDAWIRGYPRGARDPGCGTPLTHGTEACAEDQARTSLPGMTAEQALAHALGALSGWIDGYSEPPEGSGEPQRRVRVTGYGGGYTDIIAEGARYTGEPDRCFRVSVTVTEIPGEPARPQPQPPDPRAREQL